MNRAVAQDSDGLAALATRHAAAQPGATPAAAAQPGAGRAAAALPGAAETITVLRDGVGEPIVLIHPVGGDLFCYAELCRSLPPGRPVLGLAADALLAGDGAPALTELASRYLRSLRTATRRPAVLAGWSLGGMCTSGSTGRPKAVGVTHQAAHQRTCRGDTVRFHPHDRVAQATPSPRSPSRSGGRLPTADRW